MNKYLILFLLYCFSVSVYATNYYVSNSGNDNNDGLTEQTAWKTIDKVNVIMSTLTPNDIVAFKGGDEFFGTLIISKKNGITFTSYGPGKAIFKGSENISGWYRRNDNIWEISVTKDIFNVYKNNESVINARIPNLTAVNDSPDNYFMVTSVQNPKNEFSCNELRGLSNIVGAQVFIKTTPYTLESFSIIEFDHSSGRIKLGGDVEYKISAGIDFYINNHSNLLDSQNEWYYDKNTNKLLFYSISTPNKISISVINSSGIQLYYSENIKIKNLIIRDFNINGVLIDDYSSNNVVDNNEINYCYSSGVYIVSGDGNIVRNNNIRNITKYGIGTLAASSSLIESNNINDIFLLKNITNSFTKGTSGIYIASDGKSNIVKRNIIQNVGYNGINLTKSSYALVKENFIQNFCLTLEDGGAIYIYGSNNKKNEGNSTITKNIILDYEIFNNPRRARYGIYLDDHSNDVTVTYNSISGSDHGIFLHNAYNNIIAYNKIYESIGDGFFLNADSNTGGTEFEMVNNKINNNEVYLSRTNLSTVGVDVEYPRPTPLAFGIKSDWSRYNFGTFNFNKYYIVGTLTPIGVKTLNIKALGYPNTKKRMTLNEWITLTGQDIDSEISPIQLDNFNLINSSETNLIDNGNFESSMIGWQKWNTTIENASKYLHIVPTKTSGSVITPSITIDENIDYLFEFEAYAEKTSTFKINVIQNSDWDNTYETYLVDIVPGWNKYRLPFTKSISDDINIEFKLYLKQGYLDIDNIKFAEATFGTGTLSLQSYFTYNKESTELAITIPDGTWEDLDGNQYNGSIIIKPYTSKILILKEKGVTTKKADAGEDQSICSGESVTLTASGGEAYLWNTGSTLQSITVSPTRTTTYSLSATQGGITNYDQVIVTVDNCSNAIIEDDILENGIMIYPNPTKGKLNVKLTNTDETVQLEVININGGVIQSETVESFNKKIDKQMDLSGLSNGVYYIKLYNSNYNKTKKVLVY